MLERYYRELLGFLANKVGDRHAAADLVQESYARVLAMHRGGESIADPRALLYRVARNLVIDQHRRDRTRGETTAVHHQDAPDDPMDAHAAPLAWEPEAVAMSAQGVDAMLATIEGLPPRCREAFVLHKFDGLSHAEVAARMGISRKMVEQHVKNALIACRRCRNRLEGGEDRASIPRSTTADDE